MPQVSHPFTMIPGMLGGVQSTEPSPPSPGSLPCAQDGHRALITPFRQGCLAGFVVSAVPLALVLSKELLVNCMLYAWCTLLILRSIILSSLKTLMAISVQSPDRVSSRRHFTYENAILGIFFGLTRASYLVRRPFPL
jgi:hypothetical protein